MTKSIEELKAEMDAAWEEADAADDKAWAARMAYEAALKGGAE